MPHPIAMVQVSFNGKRNDSYIAMYILPLPPDASSNTKYRFSQIYKQTDQFMYHNLDLMTIKSYKWTADKHNMIVCHIHKQDLIC